MENKTEELNSFCEKVIGLEYRIHYLVGGSIAFDQEMMLLRESLKDIEDQTKEKLGNLTHQVDDMYSEQIAEFAAIREALAGTVKKQKGTSRDGRVGKRKQMKRGAKTRALRKIVQSKG